MLRPTEEEYERADQRASIVVQANIGKEAIAEEVNLARCYQYLIAQIMLMALRRLEMH